MTAELVAGLVAIVVAIVGGSVGWQQIGAHGAEKERRRQAEGRAEDAEARADAAVVSPAGKREAAGILRRIARRSRRVRSE